LRNPTGEIRKQSALWLDFEEMDEKGEFYSYGIGARTYGSIWPDRQPQPEMWQMKKSAQPLRARLVSAEKGEVEIFNRYLFTNLNKLNTFWYLQADGDILQQGLVEPDIEPQESGIIKIPYTMPELSEGVEYRLVISFRLKEKKYWADPGFEIAWEQLDLPFYKPAITENMDDTHRLEVTEDLDRLIISGNNFSYTLNKNCGALSSIKLKGKEVLNKVKNLNIWRAPLANETDEWNFESSGVKNATDGYGHFASTELYSAGIDKMTYSPDKLVWERVNDSRLRISTKGVFLTGNKKGAFIVLTEYQIDGSGKIVIKSSVLPDGHMPSWLPRIGQEWVFDKTLDQIQWYGRGPQENYPDRKTGYRIGIYKSTVKEMYEPYLIPQDYGLRTDNRWVKITDNNGTGFEFRGDKLFNFSAHPFSSENLTKALYTYQLHAFNGTTFNLDYATGGVGCTADGVFSQYRVLPQRYDFTVTIKPLIRE
jgi:beta-galactosidase